MDKRNDYNSIPKQQAKERAKNYMRLKDGYIEPKDVVLGDKTSLDAQMLDKLEPKQETLEGAANKSAIEQYEAGNSDYILGFKEGAKYQAERMYSEEDIIEFAKKVPQNIITSPLIGQLVKAGTSVGANYGEADDAESKKDFRH